MQLIHGQLVDFSDDPGEAGDKTTIRHIEKGAIVVGGDGRIVWVGEYGKLPKKYHDIDATDFGNKLIMPGFVDAHLHFPQYRMIAAYGKDLLDWLSRYTFIEEQRYGDKDFSKAAAAAFIDELIRNGTTSCLAFSTIHPVALDCLFAEAQKRGMALISGKTMMDREAPPGLCDTAQSAYDDSKTLIKKWHGKNRLRYAISPRFAVTSSPEQLSAAGALAEEHSDLLIQTHLSENKAEIEFVAKSFPEAKDYTDVYDRFGLLGPNSMFAHGIHLSERELTRLNEAGSAIIHCPTSNNFLGSGIFRYRHTCEPKRPVKTGLGCDIGGGTSFSMFDTMRDAYTLSQQVGARLSAYECFYLATLGNARLLRLGDELGSLDIGKFADLVVLDPEATPIMAARHALSKNLHDILFALMIMGDDRAVIATYISGKPQKPVSRPG